MGHLANVPRKLMCKKNETHTLELVSELYQVYRLLGGGCERMKEALWMWQPVRFGKTGRRVGGGSSWR